jgi:hypothetical protein
MIKICFYCHGLSWLIRLYDAFCSNMTKLATIIVDDFCSLKIYPKWVLSISKL